MRKMNVMLLLLIIISAAGFTGYKQYAALRADTAAPEITIDESQLLQLSVQEPRSALLQGVSAKDKRDGDVTASVVVESVQQLSDDGRMKVGYAAFDAAGNVAKASREVQYTDYEGPRFSLQEPLVFKYNSNFDIMSAIGATDVLDGDIQHRIRATMLTEEAVYEEGTHFVQFKVTNSLGDTAELALPVEIYSTTEHTATLTLQEYLVYLPAGAEFNPRAYLDTFTLQGKEVSLEAGLPAHYSLKTNGTVMTQTSGVYPVEYVVTYIDRHETNPDYDKIYTGYSKLIVVVEG